MNELLQYNPPKKTIAEQFREMWEIKGMTRQKFIRSLNISSLSGMSGDPRIETFAKLCQASGVDPNRLLGLERTPLTGNVAVAYKAAKSLDDEGKRLVISELRESINRLKQNPKYNCEII